MPAKNWNLPGGKLREIGPEALTEDELLAIIIGTGSKEKSATELAREVLEQYGSLKGILNTPLSDMLQFKGLGDVKIIKIAAAIEIGRRIQKS